MSRVRLLAALLVVAALAAAPGCIVLRDDAGVSVPDGVLARIEAGRTTRADLLADLGPPTGRFSTNLLASLTRLAEPIEAPQATARVDDDVLTWQSVQIRARVAFFPVLFAWVDSEVSSRTLTVWFHPDGRVLYAAFREDAP